MNMQYFRVRDLQKQKIISTEYQPESGNLGYFPFQTSLTILLSKVRKCYTPFRDSPSHLNYVLAPSLYQGCVKPLHNLGG